MEFLEDRRARTSLKEPRLRTHLFTSFATAILQKVLFFS